MSPVHHDTQVAAGQIHTLIMHRQPGDAMLCVAAPGHRGHSRMRTLKYIHRLDIRMQSLICCGSAWFHMLLTQLLTTPALPVALHLLVGGEESILEVTLLSMVVAPISSGTCQAAG